MKGAWLLSVALCGAMSGGCWNTRASLGVLAPTAQGGVEYLGDEALIGHACGFGERERRAFDDALSKQPKAQGLTNVELSDHGSCALVIGRPIRFSPGAPPSERVLSAATDGRGQRPESGKALVYFYRFDIGRSFRETTVALRDGPSVALQDEKVKAVSVRPGKYSGTATRSGEKVSISSLVLEADRVYYIRVSDTSSTQPSAAFGVIGARVRSGFTVELRDPAYGAAEIKWLSDEAAR